MRDPTVPRILTIVAFLALSACTVRIRPLRGDFLLAVDPNAPVISALTDSSTFGTIPVVKNFTIVDTQSPLSCDALSLSVASSDPSVIPVANVVWSGTAPNCTATITPANNTSAAAVTLTVTVTDEEELSDSDAFVVTVRPLAVGGPIVAHSSVVADFDNDGRGDIAVISSANGAYGTGLLAIHYGNGDGTFAPAVEIVDTDAAPITHGRHMRLRDVNGDGFVDVLSDNDHAIKIFYNQGLARTFTATPEIVGRALGWVYAGEGFVPADFNGDGKTDLIYQSFHGGNADDRVALRLHDGAVGYVAANWGPTASESLFPTPFQWLQSIDVGDFDGDGNLDILQVGDDVRIFYGDGVDSFASEVDLLTNPPDTAECARAADVNGDGSPDVVVTYLNSPDVTLFTNDGTGNFSSSTFTLPNDEIEKCIVADVDNDGFSDLVGVSLSADRYYVLYADGTGGFDDSAVVTIAPIGATTDAREPGVGDLNGDGCPDLTFNTGTSSETQLSFSGGPDGSGGCLRSFLSP